MVNQKLSVDKNLVEQSEISLKRFSISYSLLPFYLT
jgi:hypothetical protein